MPTENEKPETETETEAPPETQGEETPAETPAEPAPEDPIEKLASGLMADADVQRLAADPEALLLAMKDPSVVKALPPEQKAALAAVVAAARQVREKNDAAARQAAETAAATSQAHQKRLGAAVDTLKAFTPSNAAVAERVKALEAEVVGDGSVVDPWSAEGVRRFKAEAKLEALRETFGLMAGVAEAEQKRLDEATAEAAKQQRAQEMEAYMLKHPEDFSPRRDIVVESYDDEGNPVDLRVHMAGLMKGGLTLEQAHKKALRHREIGRKIARQDNPGELVIQTGGSRKVIPAPPPPGTGPDAYREWLLRNEAALLAKS